MCSANEMWAYLIKEPCLSKKSWRILKSNLPYGIGQDVFVIQYWVSQKTIQGLTCKLSSSVIGRLSPVSELFSELDNV